MLVLTRADVESVLDLDALRDAVAAALRELSVGSPSMPPRIAAETPSGGLLAAMPGSFPELGALGAKLVAVFPENVDAPTHQAVVVLCDPRTGTPIALVDGTAITAARTAAASAVAAQHLARADATVLTILGTGVQARAHADAIPRVCPNLRELRIAGRSAPRATALARELDRLDRLDGLDLAITTTTDLATAITGADIVCATTHSPDPVVRREWLRPGVHVSSVGFNTAGREVDADTVRHAIVVVESRAAVLAPVPAGANELLWAIRDGVITADHIHAEVGELVAGTRPGRTSADQITLYKSVGVAAEDLAAAQLVVDAARAGGIGSEIAF
ncbi:MAG TPA: ornithine cyclodeaminase family protein [Acidimicrobiia bacterium]|nr:ornithine cyclodeaminase family protein [Acidimicrobiia bacterium]